MLVSVSVGKPLFFLTQHAGSEWGDIPRYGGDGFLDSAMSEGGGKQTHGWLGVQIIKARSILACILVAAK